MSTLCPRVAGYLSIVADPPKKLRGRPTVLPDWWRVELDEEIAGYKTRLAAAGERWSWQRMADDLTAAAQRTLNGKEWGWDRKTIERFVDNEHPTEELMKAFCLLFPKLIQPTFVAETQKQAKAFAAVADTQTDQPKSNPEAERRLADLRELRAAAEQRASDQTNPVESIDGDRKRGTRGEGSRRPRGVD